MTFNIWEDCIKIPLPEVLSFIVDNRGKTVPTAKSGHILIATNCIRNENLYPTYEKVRYLSDDTYKNWFRAHPKSGDIIFVNKGTPGRTCMVPYPVDFCIAQDMMALRANEKIIYNRYLLAVLRSREIQSQITNTSVGDIIPHFKKSFLDQIQVPVPTMEFQHIIGDYYFAFSNKIELNKKINENLELQCYAFYRELFVNNLKPDWAMGTVADIGNVVGGSTPSKAKLEFYTEKGIPWITPKDLSNDKSKFISRGEIDITMLGLKNSSTNIMPKGTVLFSSRAPIGYIAIANNEVTTNQGFKSIVPIEPHSTAFVYFFLKDNIGIIENMASGSTFKEISGSTMKTVPAFIPDVETLHSFNEFCKPLFEQQRLLEDENRILTSLRDSLLPKLMSGEIDVSNVTI